MADVVYDENGNEVEQTGEQKKKVKATGLHVSDIRQMILDFRSFSDAAAQEIYHTEIGVGYSTTESALQQFVGSLNGGSHISFYRENGWLGKADERKNFLNDPDPASDQTMDDKDAVIDFYMMLASTRDFREEVTKFINSFVADTLWRAYYLRRFDLKMHKSYTEEDFSKFRNAFAEFDKFYNRYNNASIYNDLDIHKSQNSPEEMYEMVLDHMDDALVNSKEIGNFIINTTQASPTYMNKLYTLDRDTKEFDEFASKESYFKKTMEEAENLMRSAQALCSNFSELTCRFLHGYVDVLNRIVVLMKETLETLDNYRTKKTEAPYAIMHYDPIVKDVVAHYHLGSLGNTVVEGTEYHEFAKGMIGVLKNLAKSVVKCAPQ